MEALVTPQAAKPFVKAMAVVGRKHAEREEARRQLNDHIEEMKRISTKKKSISKHIDELHGHIANVIQAEKQFAGYDLGSEEKVKELGARISDIEEQLGIERAQYAMQTAQYRHTVDDMKKTFASLRTKLVELINDKRERDRRMQALHEKIQQGVPSSSPSQFMQPNLPPGFRYYSIGKEIKS